MALNCVGLTQSTLMSTDHSSQC